MVAETDRVVLVALSLALAIAHNCRFTNAMNYLRRLVAVCFIHFVGLTETCVADDWMQFRGPSAGHVASKRVPTLWGGFLREPVWQAKIPGKGWSSPVVIGDRIWLTSAEQVALDEAATTERLASRPYGSEDFTAHGAVVLFAVELNAVTGEILRRIDLFEHQSPNPIHAMNSYASPTPVTDGQRVICHFGSLGTACVDIASGEVLWKREFKLEEITGCGASPVLWHGNVYLACDGADQQFVIALDVLTGELKWKVNRPAIEVVDDSKRRSFSTPILVFSNARHQLISLGAQWLVSYNPDDGSQWWRAKVGTGFAAVPTPVFDRDRVFVCTGFNSPELVAVKTTGSGELTESDILWRYTRKVSEISTPIIVDSEIYFASSKGFVTCLDTETGSMHWQERVGGNFAASPTYADGRIYFTNTEGITTVIQSGRQFQPIATNQLFGETYASLSVYQEWFLLRTNPYLFALRRDD